MTVEHQPVFSIILPTRGRPEGLRNLIESFALTTTHLHALEVVLVIDEDDEASINFAVDYVRLTKVVVKPGLRMGELNMAGYEASRGEYVMLLNDDVTVRTRGWDEKVLAAFRSFPDGIVLVHANDGIFGEKLCTFPFVSRAYCTFADGICPRDYIRYRIDDHIYNVFNLLAVLGRRRILYMPELMFEHANYSLNKYGEAEYTPDPEIHAVDTKRFDELLVDRKRLAMTLMEHIDGHFSRDMRKIRESKLEEITDSVSLRRREYIRYSEETRPLSSATTRVTVGIVSADTRSRYARESINLVKRYTSNYDLVILDNNKGRDFNHSREMNRIIAMARTEYLILMDDDVYVSPGWLDGMLRCINPARAVVTPIHLDKKGDLSYAGVVMCPDYTGQHTHILMAPESPVPIPTICSAVMLIDLNKCGNLRFHETYRKYFLDVDYGLQVWEAGFQCVCSPYSKVTHLGGATLRRGSLLNLLEDEDQRARYVRLWIESGRYRALEDGIWQTVPEIKRILDLAPEVESLLRRDPAEDLEAFHRRARESIKRFSPYPTVQNYLWTRVREAAGDDPLIHDDPERAHIAVLADLSPRPTGLRRLRQIIGFAIDLGPRGTAIAAARRFLGYETTNRFLRAYLAWINGESSLRRLLTEGLRRMRGTAKSRPRPPQLSDSDRRK